MGAVAAGAVADSPGDGAAGAEGAAEAGELLGTDEDPPAAARIEDRCRRNFRADQGGRLDCGQTGDRPPQVGNHDAQCGLNQGRGQLNNDLQQLSRMESHVGQHHGQIGQQCCGVIEQVVDEQSDVLDLLVPDFQPPPRVERAQVAVRSVIMIVVMFMAMIVLIVVVVIVVQDPRRRRVDGADATAVSDTPW